MKSHTYTLTKARLHGLGEEPYWYEGRCFYVFDITFSDHPALDFNNLTEIRAGNTKDEAKEFLKTIKTIFSIIGIHEDSEVIVLVSDKNEVSAITTPTHSSCWIDVADKLKPKVFHDLSIMPKL